MFIQIKMTKNLHTLLILIIFFVFSENFGQVQPVKGKIIPDYGATYLIEAPDFPTSKTEKYRVVFDIAAAPEDPSHVNRNVETVARFLNMHSEAGKPATTMEVALVIHGAAAHGLLKNEHYREIYKVDNPNLGLFEALHQNGVEIILCGQTAMHRGITEDKRIPQAKISLSAMTALIQLQNSDYRLINF